MNLLEPAIERREFKVHQNIINHLIEAQGSTPFTALKELVQNSIDAGASSVHITLEKQDFSCIDNGRGFTGRNEIESFFETFGTPHEENYLGKKFARFRLGRSQIMGLARTTWLSNSFTMEVDFQSDGLSYKLKETDKPFNGCSITGRFYSYVDYEMLEDSLIRDFRYFLTTEIYLNGESINPKFSSEQVILESENCYVLKNDDRAPGVYVYNIGSFVAKHEVHEFGFDGVIISKATLDLDVSRKLIKRDPYWLAILEDIKALKPRHSSFLYKKLTPSLRKQFICDFIDGKIPVYDVLFLKLFNSYYSTKTYSIEELLNVNCKIVFTSFDPKDKLADYLIQSNSALLLLVSDFDINGTGDYSFWINNFITTFFSEASDNTNNDNIKRALVKCSHTQFISKFSSLKELQKLFAQDHIEIADEDLTEKEQAALAAVKRAIINVRHYLRQSGFRSQVKRNTFYRKIHIGSSSSKAAWTNGINSIHIDKRSIKLLDRGIKGGDALAMIIIHEFSHDENDRMDHSAEFYKTFHDLILKTDIGFISRFAQSLIGTYYKELVSRGLKVPNMVLAAASKEHLSPQHVVLTTASLRAINVYSFIKENILLMNNEKFHELVFLESTDYRYARQQRNSFYSTWKKLATANEIIHLTEFKEFHTFTLCLRTKPDNDRWYKHPDHLIEFTFDDKSEFIKFSYYKRGQFDFRVAIKEPDQDLINYILQAVSSKQHVHELFIQFADNPRILFTKRRLINHIAELIIDSEEFVSLLDSEKKTLADLINHYGIYKKEITPLVEIKFDTLIKHIESHFAFQRVGKWNFKDLYH